jgi:hypothetical protein
LPFNLSPLLFHHCWDNLLHTAGKASGKASGKSPPAASSPAPSAAAAATTAAAADSQSSPEPEPADKSPLRRLAVAWGDLADSDEIIDEEELLLYARAAGLSPTRVSPTRDRESIKRLQDRLSVQGRPDAGEAKRRLEEKTERAQQIKGEIEVRRVFFFFCFIFKTFVFSFPFLRKFIFFLQIPSDAGCPMLRSAPTRRAPSRTARRSASMPSSPGCSSGSARPSPTTSSSFSRYAGLILFFFFFFFFVIFFFFFFNFLKFFF